MQFYFSYKHVKHDHSLQRAYAVICGRFNITVNWDYLYAQKQGKLATVCLQRFSYIFETSIQTSKIKLIKDIIVYFHQIEKKHNQNVP